MNKLKLLIPTTLVLFSLFSMIMFFLLAYDIIVTVCYVDGNMFCSNWNTIFNIKSGFGHALSMIAFMMMSMVSSASAIDICKEMKSDAIVSNPEVHNPKQGSNHNANN